MNRSSVVVAALSGAAMLITAGLGTGCKKDKDGEVPTETVELSDTGDYTGFQEVEVTADDRSFLHFCSNYGDDVYGAVWTLEDPDGNKVFDGDAGGDGFRSVFLDDMAIALVPQSPNLPLKAGTWKVDYFIGAGNPGSVDCGVLKVQGDPGDEFDIEIVLVGGPVDTKAEARDSAAYQTAIDTFADLWDSQGLKVNIEVTEFSGQNRAGFEVITVSDTDMTEFNDLLRTAEPSNAQAITFFFVDEIENTSGSTILGLSGGPPGAAALTGTSKSGVIISTADLDSAPEDVGKIMAHEGGHFLGLWHTTERDGSEHDILDDTEQCAPSNDSNGNGTMNSDECDSSGARNVMWWTLGPNTEGLSDDQAWVMRRNPAAF